ncbi:MAG: 50S ribosomal protein L11 methyltransferase [Lactobacillales bacterium]|jgi:ribosomal protein L11 methyltransferase|nr:50S ribosomal protein L11 methyltransferase [Lactobacillales bacterium]
MNWTQLKINTASEAVEAVSYILINNGASGVEIEDSLDIDNFKSDAYGELLDKENYTIADGARVIGYFPETVNVPEIVPTIQFKVDELSSFGLDIGPGTVELSAVKDDEWATAWKKYYHPVRLTRYLTVVPSWENYTPEQADELVMKLDPGMAFGTGTHPTTRLTLQALEASIRGGETVVDVGTGSAVLAIASKLLGAGDVYAYDLDEVAVRQAAENVNLNNLDINLAASNLLQSQKKEVKADLILANILADILILLFDDAEQVLKDDGKLIISGVIEEKVDFVLEHAAKAGFKVEQRLIEGDWNAIILIKAEKA